MDWLFTLTEDELRRIELEAWFHLPLQGNYGDLMHMARAIPAESRSWSCPRCLDVVVLGKMICPAYGQWFTHMHWHGLIVREISNIENPATQLNPRYAGLGLMRTQIYACLLKQLLQNRQLLDDLEQQVVEVDPRLVPFQN